MEELKPCPYGNIRCLCSGCADNAWYEDCKSGYCIYCFECIDGEKQLHDVYLCTGYHKREVCPTVGTENTYSGREAERDAIIDRLNEQPAIDPIRAAGGCRCGECKHYAEFLTKRRKQIIRLCCRMGKINGEYPVKPDDFCSYGEPREI